MKDSSNTINSLAHIKWNRKYHIVFAPKYRKKVFYEEHRLEVREILRKLCEWKGVEIIEGEVCPDHVHMMVSIPPKMSVSVFMGYLKGKSATIIFQKWGNMKFAYRNREFWCKGYYVDTVTYFYGHFSKRRNLIHYSIKPNIPIDIGLVANHLNNLTPATLKLKEMIFDYVLCVIDRNGTGR